MLSSIVCNEFFNWLTRNLVCLPEDNIVFLTNSDSMCLASLTTTMKMGTYASHTSHLPLPTKHHCWIEPPPSKDVPLLCGPLIAGEGPMKSVAGSQHTGPSTTHKGNPQVASITCLVPMGDWSLLWLVEQSYEQAGKGSANRVSSRGSRPMVLLKVSDSGDCFLTVGEKVCLKGWLVFVDTTMNVKVSRHASALWPKGKSWLTYANLNILAH